MLLLFDIGNTHTHIGLADDRRVLKQTNIPTREWFSGNAPALVKRFAGGNKMEGAALCSVVPRATRFARKFVARLGLPFFGLTSETVRGIGIDYPKPKTIGRTVWPMRWRRANALAHRWSSWILGRR